MSRSCPKPATGARSSASIAPHNSPHLLRAWSSKWSSNEFVSIAVFRGVDGTSITGVVSMKSKLFWGRTLARAVVRSWSCRRAKVPMQDRLRASSVILLVLAVALRRGRSGRSGSSSGPRSIWLSICACKPFDSYEDDAFKWVPMSQSRIQNLVQQDSGPRLRAIRHLANNLLLASLQSPLAARVRHASLLRPMPGFPLNAASSDRSSSSAPLGRTDQYSDCYGQYLSAKCV